MATVKQLPYGSGTRAVAFGIEFLYQFNVIPGEQMRARR
jgi:hypothetical protein